ncbi:MAG: 4Fe-4S dicluster domain-containing protein [Oligoflexia bacterium]|nr:4Fe-4S dicluster domain-containing protein [Oligoflexia bacterium]
MSANNANHANHANQKHNRDQEVFGEAHKCYQCGKCFAGCPMSKVMDISPTHLMRLVHLNKIEEAQKYNTIWVCVACECCMTRCPQQVPLVEIMDLLRQKSFAKIQSGESDGEESIQNVVLSHKLFLGNMKTFGRIFEPLLAAMYNVRSMDLFKDFEKAPSMFFKGKLPLTPHRIKGIKNFKKIFENCEMKAKNENKSENQNENENENENE